MAMIRCENRHYYDNRKHLQCPYCPMDIPNGDYVQDEGELERQRGSEYMRKSANVSGRWMKLGMRTIRQKAEDIDTPRDWSADGEIGYLQRGITFRIQELHALASSCARRGERLTFWANTTKVVTITLGAVTAARGTLAPLVQHWLPIQVPLDRFDDYAPLFSVLAIIISVSTGLEAAFRFDRRGAGLTALASEAMASARQADSDWRKRIGSADPSRDIREVARGLLSDLDKRLREFSATAARHGVSYVHEIYAGRNEYVRNIHEQLVG